MNKKFAEYYEKEKRLIINKKVELKQKCDFVSADGTFDLIARPTDYSIGNIVSQRNTILTINPADIVVNVTAQ